MNNKRGRAGRGRGRGRGGRGRGQRGGGGGRSHNRHLIPTSIGFVYELNDTLDDDFRVYGQFSSDDTDTETEITRKPKVNGKKKQSRPVNRSTQNQDRSPLYSMYEDRQNYAGSSSAAKKKEPQFAEGKSKYLKSVSFTKSTSLLNDIPDDTKDSVEETEVNKDNITSKLSRMNIKEAGSNAADTAGNSSKKSANNVPKKSNDFNADGVETMTYVDWIQDADTKEIDTNAIDNSSDDDDDDDYENDLLNDFIENIDLEEGESLRDLLRTVDDSSNDDVDMSFDKYDYDSLLTHDYDEDDISKELQQEEKMIMKDYKQPGRQKNGSFNAEFFNQAIRDVPPSLKPGMRRWAEKQARREEREKKKKEMKQRKKERQEEAGEIDRSQLLKVDERIRDFIQDRSITSLQFAPMPTTFRRHVHTLVRVYQLKSSSSGSGNSRCITITKTAKSHIPRDRTNIDTFISNMQENMDRQNKKSTAQYTKAQTYGSKTGNSKSKKEKSTGPVPGTVVGAEASPIGEGNVGHRMLALMGWKEGQSLGTANGGIIAPIEAVIRKKNLGLGS
ncbi:hypothetical protein BDB01DRAFT_896608 [Pilobolus umbonatus]|nr:hypothetical protein BDB01DRAFT_896608 [Pilobolus umbonatus]